MQSKSELLRHRSHKASIKKLFCNFASSNLKPYNPIDIISESGRLRHKDDSSGDECGLEIVGVEQQDDGRWECEVGSLIGDTFQTATGDINLQVKRKKTTFPACF